jgi:WD40 repeat protein
MIAAVSCGRLRILNARTAETEAVIEPSEPLGWFSAWAVSPAGDTILWGGRDADLRLFDLSGRELSRMGLPKNAARYFSAELPESARGTASAEGTADVSPEKAPYRTAFSLAMSPDGRTAIAAYGQAYALIWDLRTGALLRCLGEEGPPDRPFRIYRVAWSPDGRTVLTRDSARGIRLWEPDTGRELTRFHTREDPLRALAERGGLECFEHGGIGAVAFSPDSRRVVAGDEVLVRVWDVRSQRELHPWEGHDDMQWIRGDLPGVPCIHDIRFSADGGRALTAGIDSTVRVWDVESGRQVWGMKPDPCCRDQADIDPDGRHVIWGGCPGIRLFAID